MDAQRVAEFVEQELQTRVIAIKEKLNGYCLSGKRIFATSSFQTQSLPLLHIFSQLDFEIPIYFLDTGYLFPQTYVFRDQLMRDLGLNVITLRSHISKASQIDKKHNFLFMTNPDRCCHINKVLPLEPIMQSHDVWVSGVRGSQSKVREGFDEEEEGKHNIIRYHPILKWTAKDIYYYAQHHNLPEHPLHEKGYTSIGCIPCTATTFDERHLTRSGRWAGMKKEECGLHTDLMKDKS